MEIILGIDPGSRVTGYGIIKTNGLRHDYIASGCIRIDSQGIGDRLAQVYAGIEEVISSFKPIEVAIEQIFMHQNPGSALKLGQARGVAIVAAANRQLPIAEYSARQVKQSVVGYGAAKKEQVQEMIKRLLNLSGVPQKDAADALAVALCHAQFRCGLAKMLGVKTIRRGRLR